jgi:hypothetical protein
MKINIIDNAGVQRTIETENVVVNGATIKEHINKIDEVQRRINEIEQIYARDVKEMTELWSKIKIY